MNTILQVCFFAISKILPGEEAIEAIRKSIRYTYGRKGEEIVAKNMKAVDETLAHLHEVKVPATVTSTLEIADAFPHHRARLRSQRSRHHLRKSRRRTPRQRLPQRRHLPHRHRQMGKAQPRSRNPRLGHQNLHPVRQVRHGLPPLCHPHQGLRLQRTRLRAAPPSNPPTRATKNSPA